MYMRGEINLPFLKPKIIMETLFIDGRKYYFDPIGVDVINATTFAATPFADLAVSARNLIVELFY